MQPQITIAGQTVVGKEEYPAGYTNDRLHNSRCFYAPGSYGFLLTQHLAGYGFEVLYAVATMEEETTITLALPKPAFFCHINLLRPVGLQSAEGGVTQCRRNSVALAFSSLQGYTFHLKKGGYRSITIACPVSFVKSQLLHFPRLEDTREN